MYSNILSYEEFEAAATKFIEISNRLDDGWKINVKTDNEHLIYLRKEDFVTTIDNNGTKLLKAEYIISYNTSYNVPLFAFNYWDSSGALLSINEIRNMSSIDTSESEFYSMLTQQEHPIFFRPYFMIHPCRTAEVMSAMKKDTSNLLVTFISLISPLIKFNLPLEYAL